MISIKIVFHILAGLCVLISTWALTLSKNGKIIFVIFGLVAIMLETALIFQPSPKSDCHLFFKKYEFGKKDTLIDEYHCGHDAEKSKSQIYQSEFSKTIFSQAPAIGSSSFLNIFKKS